MLDINAIERVGLTNRIDQIQQRISTIENKFVNTENKFSVNNFNADFQSKLDNEIARQDEVQASQFAAAQEKISSGLPVNENEIINAAKVAAALNSGNVATPDIIPPVMVDKPFEDQKNKTPNDKPTPQFDGYNQNSSENQTTEEMLLTSAQKYGVNPSLVRAVAIAESDMNQSALSPVGAIGVMQLMPETAASLGVNPYDEAQNIEGGTIYLRQMLDKFNGNVPYALAAYNAGPDAVQKYGGIPPYSETQNYVGRIMDIMSN